MLNPSADAAAATSRLMWNRRDAIEHTYQYALKGFSAKLSPSQVDSLRNDPEVQRVDPDIIVHGASLTTEGNATWGIDRIDQRDRPDDGGYTYSETGAGVNVYILDTGIRYSHTQFGGRAHLAYDAFGGNGSDCNGHGTDVAGTVGGSTYGVAKQVTLYSVRVLGCDASASLSSVIAGVDWVTKNHRSPAVANMSLGSVVYAPFDQAVEASIASGVTYVASAGNNGGDACSQSPAHLSQVLTVGASDQNDSRTSWSNYGNCVKIFAPGDLITSAGISSDVASVIASGTSQAAPHVTGVAALYLQAHPNASPSEVFQAIIGNATTGRLSNIGSGSPNRLLYSSFISGASTPPSPPPGTGNSSSTFVYSCSRQTCNFSAQAQVNAGEQMSGWYFGNGAQAGGVNVSYYYSSPGTYTVTLVTLKNGQVVRRSQNVNVSGSSSGSSTAPSNTSNTFAVSCSGQTCTFDGSTYSYSSGAIGYGWYFSDGTQAGALKLTKYFPAHGTYTVTFMVVRPNLQKYRVSRTITV